MMVLYSGTTCPFSHRSRFVLFEKGMDFEIRDVDLYNKPEDINVMNPYGQVPILVERDYPLSRDELYAKLRHEDIFARRYFYPLITDLPMYRGLPSANPAHLPVAKSISERILCLPIYPDLTADDIERVIAIIAG